MKPSQHSAVFEVDEAGTLQGSSYVYAAAQDWARLGQAYLNGVAVDSKSDSADGERILPENWTDIVSTPSRGGSRMNERYGLGFWLGHNGIDGRALSMNGFQGQSVYILPDHELVIVRLGASHAVDSGAYEFAESVAEALTSPH